MNVFLVALAASLVPGVAHAQYQMVSPLLYHGPQISYRDHQNAQNSGADQQAAVDPATFRYKPDLKRRQANLAELIARARAQDAGAGTQLAGLFASGDIFAQMQVQLAPYDLHIENLADAYALYWINAWSASRGHNDTPSAAAVAAVRAQAARALGDTPAVRGADEALRQEMAESLWIQSLLLDGAVEGAKGRLDQLRVIGAAAAQGARGMGIDVAAMTLTERGFVSVR